LILSFLLQGFDKQVLVYYATPDSFRGILIKNSCLKKTGDPQQKTFQISSQLISQTSLFLSSKLKLASFFQRNYFFQFIFHVFMDITFFMFKAPVSFLCYN
jgi:hypothetical protein